MGVLCFVLGSCEKRGKEVIDEVEECSPVLNGSGKPVFLVPLCSWSGKSCTALFMVTDVYCSCLVASLSIATEKGSVYDASI